MNSRTDKFDKFSKVFAKLSDESQDKLVKTAHRLLETHQFVGHRTIKQTRIRQKEDICRGN